jgi:hypothetical protein
MDLYFRRHDGQAVTCDDFVAAMAAASGFDFAQFMRWYDQAGNAKCCRRRPLRRRIAPLHADLHASELPAPPGQAGPT